MRIFPGCLGRWEHALDLRNSELRNARVFSTLCWPVTCGLLIIIGVDVLHSFLFRNRTWQVVCFPFCANFFSTSKCLFATSAFNKKGLLLSTAAAFSSLLNHTLVVECIERERDHYSSFVLTQPLFFAFFFFFGSCLTGKPGERIIPLDSGFARRQMSMVRQICVCGKLRLWGKKELSHVYMENPIGHARLCSQSASCVWRKVKGMQQRYCSIRLSISSAKLSDDDRFLSC